jgi:hypothetical protein
MAKPRGVVEPSMVSVSVSEYVGDVSLAGYYEVSQMPQHQSRVPQAIPTGARASAAQGATEARLRAAVCVDVLAPCRSNVSATVFAPGFFAFREDPCSIIPNCFHLPSPQAHPCVARFALRKSHHSPGAGMGGGGVS